MKKVVRKVWIIEQKVWETCKGDMGKDIELPTWKPISYGLAFTLRKVMLKTLKRLRLHRPECVFRLTAYVPVSEPLRLRKSRKT